MSAVMGIYRGICVLAALSLLTSSLRAEDKARNLVSGELKNWALVKIEGISAVEPLADKPTGVPSAIRLTARPKGSDDKGEPQARVVSPEITADSQTKLTLSFLARRTRGEAICAVQVIEPSMLDKEGRRDGMEEQERLAGHVNVTVGVPKETQEWKAFSTEFTLPKQTGPFRIYLLIKGAGQMDVAEVTLSAQGKSEIKKPDF